jgi:hypothetical protein
VTAAHAPPAAGTNPFAAAASLALSLDTAPLAAAGHTPGPADTGAPAATNSSGLLPGRAATSTATAPFSVADTAHHSPADDFFTLFPEGLWNDPLA